MAILGLVFYALILSIVLFGWLRSSEERDPLPKQTEHIQRVVEATEKRKEFPDGTAIQVRKVKVWN